MKNINKTNVLLRNKYSLVLRSIFDLDNSKSIRCTRALDQYLCLLNLRINSRGLKDTVTFLKEVNSLSVKLALGIPFSPLPFTKSDKSGFPLKLSLVKPFLVGLEEDKRIGLSITSLYKAILLPVNMDTSSITATSTGTGKLSVK